MARHCCCCLLDLELSVLHRVCLFFTLNRFFYPSVSSATSLRADASILERCKLFGHKTTKQRYYVVKKYKAADTRPPSSRAMLAASPLTNVRLLGGRHCHLDVMPPLLPAGGGQPHRRHPCAPHQWVCGQLCAGARRSSVRCLWGRIHEGFFFVESPKKIKKSLI